MSYQLTEKDLCRACAIHLFNKREIYVEMPNEEPYYHFAIWDPVWDMSDKLDDYFDSPSMMTYLEIITPEEEIERVKKWSAKRTKGDF